MVGLIARRTDDRLLSIISPFLFGGGKGIEPLSEDISCCMGHIYNCDTIPYIAVFDLIGKLIGYVDELLYLRGLNLVVHNAILFFLDTYYLLTDDITFQMSTLINISPPKYSTYYSKNIC